MRKGRDRGRECREMRYGGGELREGRKWSDTGSEGGGVG